MLFIIIVSISIVVLGIFMVWLSEEITQRNIIENLYQLWKQNPDNLNLNRKDLVDYLSADYLKTTLNDLQNG